MKKYLFIIVLLFSLILISCKKSEPTQNKNTDSCENVLTKEKEDEIKINALISLFNQYKYNHPDYNKTYEEWLVDLNNNDFIDNSYIIPIKGDKSIYVGYSTKLTPDYEPEKDEELVWTSLNEDIAIVQNGYVFGKKSGYATITLHNKTNTINGVFIIEVKDEPNTFISINLGGYHIKVLAFSSHFNEIDPFDEYYDYPDKNYKQNAIKEIEKKYNCIIEFVEVPVNDQNIYQNIKYSVENNLNYYDIAYTSTNYLYSLINDNLILNISELKDKYHNDISNRINYTDFVVGKSLYGISDDYKYFNQNLNILMYNKTLLDSLNVESPAKLYNEGKWSYDDFNMWLQDAKVKSGNQEVISTNTFLFYQGVVNSYGYHLFNDDLTINNDTLLYSLDYVKSLYESGYIASDNYVNQLNNDFAKGNALMTATNLNIIYYLLMYGGELKVEDTTYGFVPYPYPVNYSKHERNIGYNTSFGYVFINNNNNEIKNDIIYQVFYDYLLSAIKKEEQDHLNIDEITYDYLKDTKGLDSDSIKTILNYHTNLEMFDSCSILFETKLLSNPLNELLKGNITIDNFINNTLVEYDGKVDDMKHGIYPKPWE